MKNTEFRRRLQSGSFSIEELISIKDNLQTRKTLFNQLITLIDNFNGTFDRTFSNVKEKDRQEFCRNINEIFFNKKFAKMNAKFKYATELYALFTVKHLEAIIALNKDNLYFLTNVKNKPSEYKKFCENCKKNAENHRNNFIGRNRALPEVKCFEDYSVVDAVFATDILEVLLEKKIKEKKAIDLKDGIKYEDKRFDSTDLAYQTVMNFDKDVRTK